MTTTGGYGYVQADQNEWYIKKSDELKAQNGGIPVPSFLFQHIPVPEVYRLMKKHPMFVPGSVTGGSALFKGFYKGYKNRQGKFREAPCCSNTPHNQFDTWKTQGDILCAFFGHDHTNDYLGRVGRDRPLRCACCRILQLRLESRARSVTIHENSPEDYDTEILSEHSLLPYTVLPKYKQRHGYCEYKNRKPWQIF